MANETYDGIVLPARVVDELRERDSATVGNEGKAETPRPSRAFLRSGRYGQGLVHLRFEEGPLHGMNHYVRPGADSKVLRLPWIANGREREILAAAGEAMPDVIVRHATYRKRPGRNEDGSLRYALVPGSLS